MKKVNEKGLGVFGAYSGSQWEPKQFDYQHSETYLPCYTEERNVCRFGMTRG